MKYTIKLLTLELMFIAMFALSMAFIIGLVNGGQAAGLAVSKMFYEHYVSTETLTLILSTVLVGLVVPFTFTSGKPFEDLSFGDLVAIAVAMVVVNFVLWVCLQIVAWFLLFIWEVLSRFFTGFMVGFNAKR